MDGLDEFGPVMRRRPSSAEYRGSFLDVVPLMLELDAANVPLEEITERCRQATAAPYGPSVQMVRLILRRFTGKKRGVEIDQARVNWFNATANQAKICRRWLDGESVNAIARSFGYKQGQTVRYAMQRFLDRVMPDADFDDRYHLKKAVVEAALHAYEKSA